MNAPLPPSHYIYKSPKQLHDADNNHHRLTQTITWQVEPWGHISPPTLSSSSHSPRTTWSQKAPCRWLAAGFVLVQTLRTTQEPQPHELLLPVASWAQKLHVTCIRHNFFPSVHSHPQAIDTAAPSTSRTPTTPLILHPYTHVNNKRLRHSSNEEEQDLYHTQRRRPLHSQDSNRETNPSNTVQMVINTTATHDLRSHGDGIKIPKRQFHISKAHVHQNQSHHRRHQAAMSKSL